MGSQTIQALLRRSAQVGAAMLAVLLCTARADVTMGIDTDSTLQTIRGLGIGHIIDSIVVREGPFYVKKPLDGIYDSLVNELGVSSYRHFMPTGWDASYHDDLPVDVMVDMKGLREAGLDMFIGTLLGPPGYMKTNGESCCGGNLLPEWRDSLAKTVVDYYHKVKEHSGVEMYAWSMQNEVKYIQPYGSCVYTPVTYAALLNATVKVFREANLDLWLFGPEHSVSDVTSNVNFVRAVMADSVARTKFVALAPHGYAGDGTTPAEEGQSSWQYAASYANANDLEVWMTETSGSCDSAWGYGNIYEWTCNCVKQNMGALPTAIILLSNLKYGQVTTWNWLDAAATKSRRQDLLINATGPTYLYHAFKHFFRYISPGAVQVASTSDNDSVRVVAFKGPRHDMFSIVMTNRTAHPITMQFDLSSASGLPARFAKFVSTSTRGCEEEPDSVVLSEGTVLPDSSIVTLYAGPADPIHVEVSTSRPALSHRQTVSHAAKAQSVSVYQLDGRCVVRTTDQHGLRHPQRLLGSQQSAAGAYLFVTTRADGVEVKRMTGVAGSR